jgi:hypothetical protein
MILQYGLAHFQAWFVMERSSLFCQTANVKWNIHNIDFSKQN